ncbi:hypothetical protein CYMTET_27940 [Cymbomonas tetramitiformis]|uniref:Apple domain-containing protein n=1 Tax=Cymbomonas tetramitiformis TaxID=36881 RepID=A0AAE0FQA9_9CHLO|nr:hypothetical protein CYMTET_27940 [Cymbomonas tetramitiformis]
MGYLRKDPKAVPRRRHADLTLQYYKSGDDKKSKSGRFQLSPVVWFGLFCVLALAFVCAEELVEQLHKTRQVVREKVGLPRRTFTLLGPDQDVSTVSHAEDPATPESPEEVVYTRMRGATCEDEVKSPVFLKKATVTLDDCASMCDTDSKCQSFTMPPVAEAKKGDCILYKSGCNRVKVDKQDQVLYIKDVATPGPSSHPHGHAAAKTATPGSDDVSTQTLPAATDDDPGECNS